MQKRLFFLILCCLSANVQAQQIDTVALINAVFKTYTNSIFLDTVNAHNIDNSEYLVFFTHQNVQKNRIKNAYVWDKNKQNFEVMDMEILKVYNQRTKYKLISVNISISKNNTLHLYFGTSNRFEHLPPIYNKIEVLPNAQTREIDAPICYTTTTLPNGETRIISPQILRIIDLPQECDRLGNSIHNVQDAQFGYNPKTQKYEMQPFERSAERRSWFAQTYLLKPKK